MEEEPELFGSVDQHIDEGQIQPFFEERIQNIVKTNDEPVKGKVILHFDYLRFQTKITINLILKNGCFGQMEFAALL